MQQAKGDKGAVMVELALVVPILVMLLVGIIEFGQAYSAQLSINGAAREGARALALGGDSATVIAAIDNAKGLADVTGVAQTRCPSTATSTPSFAVVTVDASFTFSIPFIDLGTRTMSATASMRCEV